MIGMSLYVGEGFLWICGKEERVEVQLSIESNTASEIELEDKVKNER